MNFNDFNLDKKILKALEDAGYSKPTDVQKKAIPSILEGDDVKASAQTGTGKTAAFLLPALNKLAGSLRKKRRGPSVLILSPTRELALQIHLQAGKYSKHLKQVQSVCVVGGVPYYKQMSQLSKPHDIIVATPGRLIDFLEQGKINLSEIETLILDEADRMLDMGFSEAVEEIIQSTPTSRQMLLFSATYQSSVLKLAKKFMNNPVEINVHSARAKHDNIEQCLHYVDSLNHKNDILEHTLRADDLHSAIIFTATKNHADILAQDFKKKGFSVGALHGGMHQQQRSRTIGHLKSEKIKILVATDVAARGIDVQSISHVVNFDLPRDIEQYVHRIGRTGRAGAKGKAISFANRRDLPLVKRIEEFTGQKIKVKEIEGLEPEHKPNSRSNSSKGSDRKNSSNRKSFSEKRDFRSNDSSRDRKSFREKRDFRSNDSSRDRKSFGEKRDFRSNDSSREKKPFGEKRDFRSKDESSKTRKFIGEKRNLKSQERPFGEKKNFRSKEDSFGNRKFFGAKRNFKAIEAAEGKRESNKPKSSSQGKESFSERHNFKAKSPSRSKSSGSRSNSGFKSSGKKRKFS